MDHKRYSQTSPTCWDPDTIFTITNPSTGYPTCIGQAVTYGRRCKRVVAGHNIFSANGIVNQLAELSPSAAAKSSKLHDIARTMLCYQHCRQDEEIVLKWKRELHRYGNTQKAENTQMPRFKPCENPTILDDDVKNLFAEIKRLQEKLRRMKTEEQTSSRKSFPSNGTSTRFSSQSSARGRDDTETDGAETDEAKKNTRETQKREAKERAEKAKERAEKAKEEARRNAQAAKLAEEQKWSDTWNVYNAAWQTVEKGRCKPSRIPWPTSSGKAKDVTEASVREFFQRAPPTTEDRFRLFSQETKRWHTDKLLSRFGGEFLDGPDKEKFDLVTRAMVQQWKEAKRSKTRE